MLTDDFFERYAQALADTVRVAFDRGLEESQYLFEENAGSRDTKLRDLVVQWTTAISPRCANTSKVKSYLPDSNFPPQLTVNCCRCVRVSGTFDVGNLTQ